jgi:hypothetical protein
MAFHVPIKETIMPSNKEYKGKGMQGQNDDEQSRSDAGNLQSAGGQPGGTPAQGRSRRSQGSQRNQGRQQDSDLASGPGDNAQRGDLGSQQSGNLDRGNQSQSDLGSGPGDDSLQSSRGGGNMQSGGQGSRSGRSRLDQDDLDESL